MVSSATGTVLVNGNVGTVATPVATFTNAGAGVVQLNAVNNITAMNLTNGTVTASTVDALGGATVTFNGGGISLGASVLTISNNFVALGTNTSLGNVGPRDIFNIANGSDITYTGNITGAGDLHFYASGGSTGKLTLASPSTKRRRARLTWMIPSRSSWRDPSALGVTNTFGIRSERCDDRCRSGCH